MVTAILLLAAGALVATIWFVLSVRSRTPHVDLEFDTLPSLRDDLRTLAGLTKGATYQGNAATVLQNGALFPAMEEDMRAARHTIHLETFVWTAGEIEQRFVNLLVDKARAGVKVRVMLDALGASSADEQQIDRLCKNGVQLAHYCKPRWWNLQRFNHRTHRKLLIVDGETGYTFGHGIADQWLGDGQDEQHWRDTAVRVTGPVVQGLQSVFVENWIEETHCVPSGAGCFPPLERQGDVEAHVVSSSSGDAVSSVALLYTVAIACARHEIIIQNPYFAPDDGVCKLLAMMVRRGVAVHLMVPGAHTDSPFVRRAGCALYGDLLRAGVRLYEFQPTLIHQKIVIIDGVWSHVGSTNFDSRSLALNEEVGIGLRGEEIAAQLRSAYEDDLRRSREVTLEEWNRRPWFSRLIDLAVYQVHGQL
ncbi:MAG: phospholipase D-like domain-containing protein [Steroidobacteraceae bacterium]